MHHTFMAIRHSLSNLAQLNLTTLAIAQSHFEPLNLESVRARSRHMLVSTNNARLFQMFSLSGFRVLHIALVTEI